MLTARAADRLARRARPLPRGRGGRRAWRRLVEAAGQDDPVAIEAAVRVAAACGTDGIPSLWSALPVDRPSWWRSRLAEALWTAGADIRVPEYVVDRAWWSWLDGDTDTDPDLWELLVGWGRPAGSVLRGDGLARSAPARSLVALGAGDRAEPAVRYALIADVGLTDHPIGEMARSAVLAARDDPEFIDQLCAAVIADAVGPDREPVRRAWCVEHALAPADPVRRALFLAVTGQPTECRAVDPDGTLLAAAYDTGTPAERERLRSVLALDRDFDLVRTVVGERRRLLSSDERDYLVERLAARGDWDRLWQLIQDLPLSAAIEAAPRFGAWRPADPRAKDLLRRLVDAGARGDLAALTEPDGRWPELPVSLRVPGQVRACGVSPDGSRLAVVAASEPIDVEYAEYALDSATRLYCHGHSGYGHYYHDDSRHRVHCEADELLHLGDMIIVAETLTYPRGHGRRPERFLMRYTRYGERELWQGDLMSGPYAFDGGYVVCVSGRTLIFGRGDDDWAVRREEDLGRWLDDRCPSRAQAQLLDTDPPTGRILVRRGDWIAVLDGREGTVLAYGVGGRHVREATFTGREHLVTRERHGRRGVVRTWRTRRRRSGGLPGRLTPSPKPVVDSRIPTDSPTRLLAALRDWDRVAIHPPGEAVAFLDSRTLRAAGPPVPCAFTPREVWSKASDPFLVLSDGDGGIEIHVSTWGEMLRRPMSEGTPRHLEWAIRATTDARRDETLGEALGLYRAFLELRFG